MLMLMVWLMLLMMMCTEFAADVDDDESTTIKCKRVMQLVHKGQKATHLLLFPIKYGCPEYGPLRNLSCPSSPTCGAMIIASVVSCCCKLLLLLLLMMMWLLLMWEHHLHESMKDDETDDAMLLRQSPWQCYIDATLGLCYAPLKMFPHAWSQNQCLSWLTSSLINCQCCVLSDAPKMSSNRVWHVLR